MRVLLLGGTSEASRLAAALAARGVDAIFSYAGRTDAPIPQPLPTRVGGFGGVEGLIAYLRAAGITHMVDATHPFAAGMSRNAVAAAAETGIPLLALERQPWTAQPGDLWRPVEDVAQAVADLPEAPHRVFLAIGRQNIGAFAARPQHFYLLRMVEAPRSPPLLPDHHIIATRGPFSLEDDLALMRAHGISWVVSKNAGGPQAGAKIEAARQLGLPVTLIARPPIPPRPRAETVEEALAWLMGDHGPRLGV